MRALVQISESPLSVIPQSPYFNTSDKGGALFASRIYSWLFECHGFLHNVFLIGCSSAFVLYLAYQSKRSFAKLSNGRSYIMIAYYGCLWLVSLLNLAWCIFQVREVSDQVCNFFRMLELLQILCNRDDYGL